MSIEENHDVFAEDNAATTSEADIGTETEAVTGGAQQEAATQTEARTGAAESTQEGEGTTAETPAAGDSAVSTAEKMIPESRLKAAVKDVNDRLIQTQRELAAMKEQPAPDRLKDPDGYDRDYRIKMSRNVVSKVYKDYDVKIAHFQEMAKREPSLNAIVANNDIPAQMAYDLAAKDMELTELEGLRDSPDWKEFQEYKASKAAGKNATLGAVQDTATQLGGKNAADAASKVPNLNRNAPSLKGAPRQEDSDLFKDHYSTGF